MPLDSPVQTPITGGENTSDRRNSLQVLSQFYRALNSRDLELIRQNWADSVEVSMHNPLGGLKRGWREIQETYKKLFSSKGAYRFEFYDYTVQENADFFYVVGRERGEFEAGGRLMRLAIRTTRVFRRDKDGMWRQVHHHGSIDDPQMLAAYQEAVLD